MIFELGNKRLKGEGKYWIAPNANVIGDVILKNDSSVWFNAVIRGDIESITLGEGSNVQDNCVLHTDKGFPLKNWQDGNSWSLSDVTWLYYYG
jgi:carbonic anhydrase/acetyltransferase-like protein (isoleucine patch superfamily)